MSFGAQYSFWTWICLDRKTRLRTEKTHFLVKKDCAYYLIYMLLQYKKVQGSHKISILNFCRKYQTEKEGFRKCLHVGPSHWTYFGQICTEHIFWPTYEYIHKKHIWNATLIFTKIFPEKSIFNLLTYRQMVLWNANDHSLIRNAVQIAVDTPE